MEPAQPRKPTMPTAEIARAATQELLRGHHLSGRATIEDGAPLLRTRFAAADAAAAALAAGGVAAATIHAQRTGQSSDVRVERRHAEASLLSFAMQRFLDPARAPEMRLAPEQRTAAAGFHPTLDGRMVYLHAGFPHNTRGLLELLGVADERAAVRAAVASRTGQELEDAIARAGLCGALVRDADEWDASDAGVALAARPVVDVVQVGDSPPMPFPETDIRVLDLTRVLAGPTCARTLAMYGADSLRIGAAYLPSIPMFVTDTGLGKRSAFVDLKTQSGCATLRRLIGEADVFSQGYRSGALDRLGFGVADVVRARPGIVYVSINCYGHEGAWRTRPGWEQLAQTVTGVARAHGLDVHGAPDRPELLPAAVNDYTTGYLAAFGVMVALLQRARYGGSFWVRVSLARTSMWLRSLGLAAHLPAVSPPGDAELDAMRNRIDTAWGPLEHLRAPVSLSNAAVGWNSPPVPLGTHTPEFS
jgi:crotonobetainyl-CoA:carnitine CoA-transferase CaiB-like acyl-CoA transferase